MTVGGAIASDVHGKGHHVDGTFGAHVSEMEMLLADGCLRTITPASDPDLWWATIGGMGLTGLILRATFDLIPIETQHILVVIERVPNFDSLLERMVADDHLYRYSVAWIDLIATGKHLGRAALGRGNHATLDDLRRHPPPFGREPARLRSARVSRRPTRRAERAQSPRRPGFQRGLVPQDAEAA